MKASFTIYTAIAVPIFFILSNSIFSQNIVLTFTGEEESTLNHVSTDSIFIRNMTQGGDTMLIGNDTIFELILTGIPESRIQSKGFELIQNYPNPFTDKTTFGIRVSKEKELFIEARNIFGQKLAGYSGTYKPGLHLFSFAGNQNAFYIVTVTNTKTTESIKLVNSYQNNSPQHNITYLGYQPENNSLKNSTSLNGIRDNFPFTPGDKLQYIGFSNGYQLSVLYDQPEESTDYVFEFELPDTFVCGDVFTDKRDGKTYETVQIGNQCWMAENMNVGDRIDGNQQQDDNTTIEKYCYADNDANCNAYGGLYQWHEMMQYDTNRYIQGVCPEGWHLPKISEWNELVDYAGGPTNAGTELKVGGSIGFDALMSGYRSDNGLFTGLGDETYFWTSVQGEPDLAYYNHLTQSFNGVNSGALSGDNGYAVRCVKGLAPIINENVVVVDTNIYELISDSIELSQGIYIYQYNNNRRADDIILNDVIIGYDDDGYLRKVETIIDEPPILTLETGIATLEDVFYQLEIHEFFEATEDAKDDGPPMLHYSGEDIVLLDEPNIDIIANELSQSYDPSFYFDCEIEDAVCYYVTIQNTHSLTYNSVMTTTVGQSVYGEFSVGVGPEFKKKIWLTQFVGFPLWITFKAGMSAGMSIGFDDGASITTGYHETRSFTAGIEYENGSWGTIWETEKESEFDQVELGGSANSSTTISFGPEISLMLYGIAGPFVWGGVYSQFNAHVNGGAYGDLDNEFLVGLGVNAGVKAEIEFELAGVTIFSWVIGKYEVELASTEVTLWNIPDEVIIASGNNQEAPINEQLPNPIKVKVTDNFGNGFANIPVHFTIEEGGGSLSNYNAYTNGSGIAQTDWTMGPNAGENILYSSVFIADGTHIDGSPVIFTATAIGSGTLPTVSTASISNITETTAESGGNVTDDGGSTVTARGICWDTSPSPNLSDSHTSNGTGTGSYISYMTGLIPNTEYYVRAYATNDEGTAYGNQQVFTTQITVQIPTVTTTAMSNIMETTAQSGGNVTDDGGSIVTARGVCWNTSPSPTISNGHTTDGTGTGNYISYITGLAPNTEYYLRAYATNDEGTAYGNQLSFTTDAAIPTVTTTAATGITAIYAQTGGNVTDEGSANVTVKGVCWDTSPNPDLNDNYTTDGSGPGSFISILNSLTPNTTYYVKAYASNTYGTSYGNQISFTTSNGAAPVADFIADVLSGDAPLTVSFTDLSTNSPYQWFWEFGDGFTSFSQNPTHTYQDEGIYTVSLTVDNTYGSDTETKTDYIAVNAPSGVCPSSIEYEGQLYSVVEIGTQCWMAENLNVGQRIDGSQDMLDNSVIEKYCYDDNDANCNTYGGLYKWNEVMQYTTLVGTQGICPDGWHIPTDEEWKQLEGEVDSQFDYPDPEWDRTNAWRGFDVGYNLKSTTDWETGGNGNNSSGFNILGAGQRNTDGTFDFILYDTHFFTSNIDQELLRWFVASSNQSYRGSSGLYNYGFSVRCIKD